MSFDSAEYIEHCIGSVLGQDFDDYEYVIIDGGSTDGTREIIEKYSGRLAYWQSKPDRGLYHAFNLGVLHSRGRWLLFLNSDDYFAGHDVFSKFAPALHQNPDADVVFGQIFVVTREKMPETISGPHGRAFEWRRFIVRDIIPHPAAFTKRDFIEKYEGFSEEYTSAADYELYLRAGRSLKAIFIPTLVAYMRLGGKSTKNFVTSLMESRKAQMQNSVRSNASASMIFVYHLIRGIGSSIARRISYPVTRSKVSDHNNSA